MVFDPNEGQIVTEARYALPPKEALIAAVCQLNGNFNTGEYPKDLPGIEKSSLVKGRLLYAYSEDTILYSQPA